MFIWNGKVNSICARRYANGVHLSAIWENTARLACAGKVDLSANKGNAVPAIWLASSSSCDLFMRDIYSRLLFMESYPRNGISQSLFPKGQFEVKTKIQWCFSFKLEASQYLTPHNTVTQQTQNICKTFFKCWTNVKDVGATLYKCYTKSDVCRRQTLTSKVISRIEKVKYL